MARRNANGEGSIYQRKDGRWEGSVHVNTTSGQRKRLSFYGKTRAQVHAKLTDAKAKEQQGVPVPAKSWKLGDYLDYWLKHAVCPPKRRPTTHAQAETVVRLYLKPGLGKLALTSLSVATAQGFFNKLLADGQSIPNVAVIRKVLSAALTYAQRQELVNRNVARLTELPPSRSKRVTPWTADEALRFLQAARTHPLRAAFVLLALYGFRRGEVLGLRWSDVDFRSGVLKIRQQVVRVGRSLVIGPVKTKASEADLPLLRTAEQALIEHRAKAAKEGREVRRDRADSDLVFTTSSGSPIEPRNFVRSFQRLCTRHEIRLIRVHDIRHSLATLLGHLGVPPRIIQAILRHSRMSTTQEVYVHPELDYVRDALVQAEGILTSSNKLVEGDTRCRQALPSTQQFSQQKERSLSGGATGTRTLDLIHAMKASGSVRDRFAEVNSAINVYRRHWMLGLVAVSVAVSVAVRTVDAT